MRRRQFATLGVAGAALHALPKGSRAQQPQKLPLIGWLWPGHSTGNPQEVAGFQQGLKDFGYKDRQMAILESKDSRLFEATYFAGLLKAGMPEEPGHR